MKIIHIVSGDFGRGGAERLVADLAEEQYNQGNDVTICSFRAMTENSVAIPSVLKSHSFNKKKGFSPMLAFQIFKYLKKEKPDVVNCHLPATFLYMILSLFTLKSIKFFYTIHTMPNEEEKRSSVIKLKKYVYSHKLMVPIAISDSVKSNFVEIYGQDLPLIYNGSKKPCKTELYDDVRKEIASYKKSENTKVFVAVGRIAPVKNHILMIRSFAQLHKENADAILLLLGSYYDMSVVEQCKKEQTDNVFILGNKNNVRDYLLCSDAFCMSSIYEGMPISIIEAMSVGLPIISTNVGGIPDMVKDGWNGYLTDMSVDSYVGALKKFISLTETERESMSGNNRKMFAELYDIEQCALSYLKLYKE